MADLKQSTATDRMIFMTDSTDHVSGKTGLTLTITASKAGAAFASISPTVTDRGSGWYSLALTTGHTDTLGDLVIHATSTGADPTDKLFQVVAYDPGSATTLGLSKFGDIETDTQDIQSRLPAALVSGRIDASVGAMATDTITSGALATSAVTEIVDAIKAWSVVTGYTFETLMKEVGAALAGNVTGDGTEYRDPVTDSIRLTVSADVDGNRTVTR